MHIGTSIELLRTLQNHIATTGDTEDRRVKPTPKHDSSSASPVSSVVESLILQCAKRSALDFNTSRVVDDGLYLIVRERAIGRLGRGEHAIHDLVGHRHPALLEPEDYVRAA